MAKSDVNMLAQTVCALEADSTGRFKLEDGERKFMCDEIDRLEESTGMVVGHSCLNRLWPFDYELRPDPWLKTYNDKKLAAKHQEAMRGEGDDTCVRVHYIGCRVDLLYHKGVLIDAVCVDRLLFGQSVFEFAWHDDSIPHNIACDTDIVVRGTIAIHAAQWMYSNKDEMGDHIIREAYPQVICELRDNARSYVRNNLAFVAECITYHTKQLRLREQEKVLQELGFTCVSANYLVPYVDRFGYAIDGVVYLYDEWRQDGHETLPCVYLFNRHNAWTYTSGWTWSANKRAMCQLNVDVLPTQVGSFNTNHTAWADWFPNKSMAKELQLPAMILLTSVNNTFPVITGYATCKASKEMRRPERCPSCGRSYTNKTTCLCRNPNCPSRLYLLLTRFVSEYGMDISALATDDLRALVDTGLVQHVSDLYKLETWQLMSLPMSQEKATRIREQIVLSRNRPLSCILYALPLRLTRKQARKIGSCYSSFGELRQANSKEMCAYTGFSIKFCRKVLWRIVSFYDCKVMSEYLM